MIPARAADLNIVRQGLRDAAERMAAGRVTEARDLCADLILDFQPLIAGEPGLRFQMLETLARCGAVMARRRLLAALGHGDA